MRNKCEAIIIFGHIYNIVGFPCNKDAVEEFLGRFYCINHYKKALEAKNLGVFI